jgi:hypothetical protein
MIGAMHYLLHQVHDALAVWAVKMVAGDACHDGSIPS